MRDDSDPELLRRRAAGLGLLPVAPKVDLRCSVCGYGIVSRTPPERCPMCGGDGRWSKSPGRTGRPATLDERLAG